MKIWVANLLLTTDDNGEYKTKFIFELQDKEYELTNGNIEWIYRNGYVIEIVPTKMRVGETYFGNPKVTQGFDHKLNSEELKELEYEMRKLLTRHLKEEKEKMNLIFDKKILSVLKDI